MLHLTNEINSLKTPYFLIDTKGIKKLICELRGSLDKYFSSNIIGYSFKTNNLPWIIQYMRNNNMWAEVVSSDEYDLALKMGYSPEKIIFNGPIKSKEKFILAIEQGSIVNIDSQRELTWLGECDKNKFDKVKIGLRVNFCIEDKCPGESQCGIEDGRFGFSYETGALEKVITQLQTIGISLSGLHLHCSSKTRSVDIYHTIAKIATEIVSKYDLSLQYIDVGGGFFGGVQGKPTFEDYILTIKKELSINPKLKDITLIVEPGMSLVGANIDYVTTVVDLKKTKNNYFALLDGSRIHVDPLFKKTNYTYYIISGGLSTADTVEKILCGFTCMEGDRFFKTFKTLCVGDKVVFQKVGAYTMGLSPQFIQFYPPVYAVTEDNKLIIARRQVNSDEFYSLGRV